MNSQQDLYSPNTKEPKLHSVGDDDQVPRSEPVDTYLVDSDGEARPEGSDPAAREFVPRGKYFLWLGIAIGVLGVIALVRM